VAINGVGKKLREMGRSRLELEQQIKNKNRVIETQIETLDEYRKTIKKLKLETSQIVDSGVNLSFKEKMLNDIIPFVEKLIERESSHLYQLERKKAPTDLIEKSKKYLSHYRQKHKEYVEFVIQSL
jgi:hypothetical protein